MMHVPGICRFCKCTEESPCGVPPCGEPCAWANRERDVCTNPTCLIRWADERRAQEARSRAAKRKRTPAEIHELILRKKRGNRAQRRLKGLKPKGGNAA